MKILLALASVAAFAATPAFAGEISHRSLANMGLSGMQQMSDADGMQVRGLSIAVVGGYSSASIHGAGGSASSTNFYFAAGHHSASGANLSGAADASVNISHYPSVTINVVAAGGFSTAHAH